jgi:hypothetical protein
MIAPPASKCFVLNFEENHKENKNTLEHHP